MAEINDGKVGCTITKGNTAYYADKCHTDLRFGNHFPQTGEGLVFLKPQLDRSLGYPNVQF